MALDFNQKLGVIGGGQLSKMLLASANKWGFKSQIYTNSLDDPASTLTKQVTLGPLDLKNNENKKSFERWVKGCDVVTIESEWVDLSFLGSRAASRVFPSPKNIKLLRDRESQKNTLIQHNIATSAFTNLKNTKAFKKPQVFKKRLFGYDGYGTEIIKNKKDHLNFLKKHPKLSDWIAEGFIPFKRELAFSMARNSNNDFCLLPLVETKQKNAKCFWVKGPVENKNLKALIKKAKSMMKKLNYVGLLTFELFELKDGSLMVNEVAPRVHNSAHYSIEALALSQFDLHLLAITGSKLPKILKPHSPFAMVNLIGSGTLKPKIFHGPSTSLHWYGKKHNRKGRKMGHLTSLGKTKDQALKQALLQAKRQRL